MKKNMFLLMLTGFLAFSILGCGISQEKESGERDNGDAVREQESSEKENSSMETVESTEEEFSFASLKNLRFCFSSGAGAWGTTMVVREDGTFSGEYSDSDMGDTGDGYPAGTMYLCNFTGRFTEPEKVNAYTYSTEIQELNCGKEPGTEEIKGDILYKYSTPYGLEEAKNILIYLPGAPLSELSQDFRGWVGYYELSGTEETVLPFYALNNESLQQGFSSYDIRENWENAIQSVSERSEELENSITNDPLNQSELNETSMELFELWDDALNILGNDLKQILDEEKMALLTREERAWIESKDQETAKAGAECEGGSMQTMLENLKAANMTKERVYELMEIIERN